MIDDEFENYKSNSAGQEYNKNNESTKNNKTMTYLKINDMTLYEFDPESGVLRVSMSPGDLEILAESVGGISETGTDIALPAPFSPFKEDVARFPGVKRLESIVLPDGQNYLMSLSRPEAKKPEAYKSKTAETYKPKTEEPKKQKGFFGWLKNYFKQKKTL